MSVKVCYYVYKCIQFKLAINEVMAEGNYQVNDHVTTKIIQLYETKNSRHSTMIVGKSGGGKSVTWKGLQKTLSQLQKSGVEGFNIVKVILFSSLVLNCFSCFNDVNGKSPFLFIIMFLTIYFKLVYFCFLT